MQISASIRERALLDILELQACGGGRPASLADLAAAWPYTGLRAEDFESAIEDLRKSACLASRQSPRGTELYLTALGVEFLQTEPRNRRELDEQLRIRQALAGAARRWSGSFISAAKRRAIDQHAVTE